MANRFVVHYYSLRSVLFQYFKSLFLANVGQNKIFALQLLYIQMCLGCVVIVLVIQKRKKNNLLVKENQVYYDYQLLILKNLLKRHQVLLPFEQRVIN